ncbi:hypothetical protein BHE74_00048490 [Ensete ventricosum]|nr:hypothetical protein BHE74_00048490 [Ensete ventricosum]
MVGEHACVGRGKSEWRLRPIGQGKPGERPRENNSLRRRRRRGLKRVVVSIWKGGGPTAKGGKERLGNGGVAVAAPESDESTGRGGYDLIALAGMRRQADRVRLEVQSLPVLYPKWVCAH